MSSHGYRPRLARDNAVAVAADVPVNAGEVLTNTRISRCRVARDSATIVSHAASNLSPHSAALDAEAGA